LAQKTQQIEKPDVFQFSEYRDYLRQMYLYLKETKRFSYRSFSREAGYKSSNMLKFVIDGERNLSAESAEKVCQVFKLTEVETNYFKNLVLFNQAKSNEEKRYFAHQLVNHKGFKKFHPLKESAFHYLSQWYLVAIRELVGCESFIEDPAWIASQLRPNITKREAKRALKELQEMKLIRRDDTGRLVQTKELLATDDEVSAQAVPQFHKLMIQKGLEAVDRFEAKDRNISALTIGISPEKARHVAKLIHKFRSELLLLADDEKSPDSVYQVNFQLFPLAVGEADNE